MNTALPFSRKSLAWSAAVFMLITQALSLAETPPIIMKQPVDVTAAYGDTVTLRVEAIGPNLSYEWQKQAGLNWWKPAILGNRETLTLENLAAEDAGTYRVVVRSAGFGSAFSREAKLSFPASFGTDRIRALGSVGQVRAGLPAGPGVALAGKMLYPGYDPETGIELWVTDGTAAGTRRVADLLPGEPSGLVLNPGPEPSLAAYAGRVYFIADDGQHGRALWASDGTAAGTTLVQSDFLFVRNVEWMSGAIGGSAEKRHSAADLRASGWVISGGILWFRVASSGVEQLARTDGSASGTRSILPDSHDASNSFYGTPLAEFKEVRGIVPGPGGGVFFAAETAAYTRELWVLLFTGDTATSGRELWFSAGTDAGTRRVRSLAPGSADGLLTSVLRGIDGKVYFTGYEQGWGFEPAVSDGTLSGTGVLRDINPSAESSLPFEFTPFAGKVFFSARSATGVGLWKTDGTPGGTELVKELLGVSRLMSASQLVGADRLYFMGREAESGFELWTSDGTPDGTRRLRDLAPGTASSSPRPLGNQGSSMYFINESPPEARALWFSDGTEAGTVRLAEGAPFLDTALQRSGAETYFAGAKQEGGREIRIYKTSGTPESTVLLKTLPHAKETTLQWIDLGPRKMLNTAGSTTTDFRTGELIVTDGTPAGTEFLNLPAVPGTVGGLTAFKGGLLYVTLVDESSAGLYRVDGTSTRLLKLFPSESTTAISAVTSKRALIVLDSDNPQGNSLLTDGTPEGTKLLHLRGAHALNKSGLGVLGETFMLALGTGQDPETREPINIELFRIGQAGVPEFVRDLAPGGGSYGPRSGSPAHFVPLGDKLLFFSLGQNELWRTDGTTSGTEMIEELLITDFNLYGLWDDPAFRPGKLGNSIFFGAGFPASAQADIGIELWKSAGSALHTFQLRDIYPGSHIVPQAPLAWPVSNSSHPAQFTRVGNTLFFTATSPLGRELWRTDGTLSGTVLVKDLSTGDEEQTIQAPSLPFFGGDPFSFAAGPSTNKSNPTNFTAVGNRLFFVARDDEGTKLFSSDGTAAGTAAIEMARSGFGAPRELTSCNDRLYFVRSQIGLAAQVWECDPATQNVRKISDLARGVASPALLTESGGRLYFIGNDGTGPRLHVYERVPLIKEHPASQTILANGQAVLQAAPADAGASYVWRRGAGIGTPIGSGPSLAIAAANATEHPYFVRATRDGASAQISHPAHIRVLDAALSKAIQESPNNWWTLTGSDPEPSPTAPGVLDLGWGSSNMVNGLVRRIVNLPDGKILIAGTFSEVLGTTLNNLARLNHDGTLDSTFAPGTGPDANVNDLVVLSDGKIVIVGGFLTVNGYQRQHVARLHPDGGVDLEFKPPLFQPSGPSVLCVLPAADGKIYIGGVFGSWAGHETTSLARLNADGTIDPSFTVSNQPNTGGPFRIAALAYYPSSENPQQILVGGGTYFVEPGNGSSNQRRHIGRLSAATGAWDVAFNTAPIPNPPASLDGSVSQILPLPDGKILVGGIQGGGHTGFDGLVRLNSNGTLDPTFQSGPTSSIFGPTVAAQPFGPVALTESGKIVAGGRFSRVQNNSRSNIVQLLPDGPYDPAFGADGPNNEVSAVAVQEGGGIIIAGTFTKVDGVDRRGLARLNGDPAPPRFILNASAPILEASSPNAPELKLKVNVLGSPPPKVTWFFGDSPIGDGPVLTVSKTNSASQGTYYAVIQNGAGIVQTEAVSLTFNSGPPVIVSAPENARLSSYGVAAIFKVEAAGALPLSYQWKSNGVPILGATEPTLRFGLPEVIFDNGLSQRSVLETRHEKLPITVEIRNSQGTVESAPVFMVLSSLGAQDPCFYPATLPLGIDDNFLDCRPPASDNFASFLAAETAAHQPGGHIVVGGGEFTSGRRFVTTPYLARFTEWGVPSYEGDGRPDAPVRAVATATDGAVYIAGDFKNILNKNGSVRAPRRWLAKYDAQMNFVGSFSPTFLPENSQVHGLLVQPDGKLLIAGTFSNVNGSASLGIARLLPSGQSDPAFSSGITDLLYAKPMALALQSDGKILLGGQGAYFGAGKAPFGEFRNQLCRLHPNGSWDATFETAGGAGNAGYVEAVTKIVVQPDDRILIGGVIARWGAATRNGLARLMPDGAVDHSFNPGSGPDGSVSSFALLPNGEVLVCGNFTKFDGKTARQIARLKSDGSVDQGYWSPVRSGARFMTSTPDGDVILIGSFRRGFFPPVGTPTVTTRDWQHPQTGSIHKLPTYTWDPQCPGHGSEIGQVPEFGDFCGMSYTYVSGVMRLRGRESDPQPPAITVQPSGVQALAEGGVATLFAGAVGEDLQYQWRKDGVDLPGQTRPALRLDRLSTANSGKYSVLIYNALGAVVSSDATVEVTAAASERGKVSLASDLKKLEWAFSPAPGRVFSQADLQKFTLQVSEDLRRWTTVPGAVALRNGELVFSEEQTAARQKRFYRLVSTAQLSVPSAAADPATEIPLTTVPEVVRNLAAEHLQAFVGTGPGRSTEQLNWSGAEFASEARLIFDPAHKNGSKPAYVELRLASPRSSSAARGYIIASLLEDDFPIVEFGTHGPTKTDQVLAAAESGVVKKFMRFTPGFIAGEDASGQRLSSLGTTPLRIVGELPDEGVLRYASFDSATRTRLASPRSGPNLVPFGSYEELRADFQGNPMRQETRRLRKTEAGSRWKMARRQAAALRVAPGEERDVLSSRIFASARVELDDGETSPVQVEVLRTGGLRLRGESRGSVLIRTRDFDGSVEFHSVTVAPPRAGISPLSNCAHIETQQWMAGGGWDDDQRQYHQTKQDAWCPSVGCGPTALAMLFGWWDYNGVPSAFYRLKQGQGNAHAFRFDFDSLRNSDAPKTAGGNDTQPIRGVYNDLHGLCNVMCDPFGSGGGTYPDQMESAFYEYVLRVADIALPWPSPMNEFGTGFIGVTSEASWVPPGGMTDWEGGGKLVAQGIKEGRPGIIGIGLCLCDPPHYALAFGYMRMTGYVGCDDPEAVATSRFFLVNMGHGPGNPPEWHVAEDVWFGLTANLWQKKLPQKEVELGNLPGDLLSGFLGSGQKLEVRRPALAVPGSTAQPRRLFLAEGDRQGNTPTAFTRIRSLDGGSSYSIPLLGIGSGLFRSGPALVAAADGQRLLAFGLGTDKRLYRATSQDAGMTWPDAWTQFSPPRAYESAPAAAASGGAATVHVAAMGTDDAFYALVSRNSGITWSAEKPLGGVFKSAPALAASFDGRTVHAFGVGTDRRIWRAITTDAGTNWFGWAPVGQGLFNSAPAAATSLDGKTIHLFARGLDARYYRYVSTDTGATWAGPIQVPDGIWTSGPSISLDADGQTIRLAGRGTEPSVPDGVIPDPSQPRIWIGVSPDGGATWPGGFQPIVPALE